MHRFFVLVGLALFLWGALLPHGEGSERIDPFNIILISVDTLRADHLSCYDYKRSTSPRIDRFAQKGVLFYNAVSQSTATLPSHSSIFTSRYPSQHKTIKIGPVVYPLDDSEITLAEILKDNGYLTAAFTGGGEMSHVYNIDQGFDVYDDEGGGIAVINPKAVEWLKENGDKRFFLFIHCYDTHSPYEPPVPFRDLYILDFQPSMLELNQDALHPEIVFDRESIDILTALYDAEINYVDQHIGELFDTVNALGLADGTLIIFTSDHGEEFAEHLGFGHGKTVYEEQIRVPLIFRHEKFWGRKKIMPQVRSIDIAPTVLDLLGIPVPEGMMGRSLKGMMAGEASPERPSFSESERRDIQCCRTSRYKLIINNDTSQMEFYDLLKDPGEQKLLSLQNRQGEYRKLEKEINEWTDFVKRTAQANEPDMNMDVLEKKDKKLIEQLRSLGYM